MPDAWATLWELFVGLMSDVSFWLNEGRDARDIREFEPRHLEIAAQAIKALRDLEICWLSEMCLLRGISGRRRGEG